MDYQENRLEFLRQLGRLCEQLQLTPRLKELMKWDRLFGEHMNLMKSMSDEQKKTVILLELTRKRDTCDALIGLLRADGQTDLATKITEMNRSPARMSLFWMPLPRGLHVSQCWGALGRSDGYKLDKRVRGRFYIVNNVEEPQKPDIEVDGQVIQQLLGLRYETNRFEQIFTDLHFVVKRLVRLNAKQLKKKLIKITKDPSLKEDQAFGLMVISHGQNEKIYGFEACEAKRKINFREKDGDKTDRKAIGKDQIAIREIIDVFANCPFLSGKPKLFFFNSCRIGKIKKTNKKSLPLDSEHSANSMTNFVKMTTKQFVPKRRTQRSGPTHRDEELHMDSSPISSPINSSDDSDESPPPQPLVPTDSFVAYACAKGYKSFFDAIHGFSYFGQALSHSIAQYACEESLSSIMSRTQSRLKEIYESLQDIHLEGDYSTEVISYAMSKQLYFNPGHIRRSESFGSSEEMDISQENVE